MLRQLAANHLFFDFEARCTTSLPPLAALGLRTSRLLAQRHRDRDLACAALERDAAAALGLRSLRRWEGHERKVFADFAPLVLLAGAARWPQAPRRALISLIRAKAADSEHDYVRELAAHAPLCRALFAQ